MTPRALILGGRTGLLGQALVRACNARHWNVQSLGRDDGDLLDYDWLVAAIESAQPDIIFNTIAWTQVDAAEEHASEAYRWNRALPSLLGRIVHGSPTHLLHYSTDFVFSGHADQPYTEEDTPEPASVYGASKLEGEEALRQNAPKNSCIVRTAWLFGPGRRNFVSVIVDACKKKDAISVVHDQKGSPTYSLDLAHWSVLLAEKKATGLFHAVNGGRATWCELACEAVALAETTCRVEPISSAEWPQKAKRPSYSVLGTSKLTATLGVAPRPWPQALRDYIFQEFMDNSLRE